MVVVKNNQLIHTACFVPNDGGTTFVLTSPADRVGNSNENTMSYYRQMLRELVSWAFAEGGKLLQVLMELDDRSRRTACLESGFYHLTDLIYLYRSRQSAPLMFDHPEPVQWINYDDSTHELFKTVIARTYRQSLDCPELENLRDMEDVIRAHKAAGQFSPKLWKVLTVDGQPAGVLILSPLRNSETMELTYMGLCRDFRGRRLGHVLLGEALHCLGQNHLEGLTLAVDQRNLPALTLYTRFGFMELFRRTVMLASSAST